MIAKFAAALTTLAVAAAPIQVGRSLQGRPITLLRAGNRHGSRVLVVGCIHGDECAGIAIVRALEHARTTADMWLLPDLNLTGTRRARVRTRAAST